MPAHEPRCSVKSHSVHCPFASCLHGKPVQDLTRERCNPTNITNKSGASVDPK